jgi:hypothetical protein
MDSRYRFAFSGDASPLLSPVHRSSDEGGEEDHDAVSSYTAPLESFHLGTSEENVQLLSGVDKLRECNFSVFTDLPQVVVVGDQSAGKSSVLEALTQIPFPRSWGGCTRFTTQIKLRRASVIKTVVEIIPDPELPLVTKLKLAGFKQTLKDQADFVIIIQHAMDAIFPPGSQHSFLSKDILSIEVSGPNQPHLTVVDLPGIFHAVTMNQTATDIETINSLAKSYMEKEGTIVLSVICANNEIPSQAALYWAKKFDPKGIRTLGIITKPDLALTEEHTMEFINLALNKDRGNKLPLGWHVLRNRAYNEMEFTADKRRKTEQRFFALSKWGAKLEASQLGVDALSKRLDNQLIRHIAAEVFKVQADIEHELARCEERLRVLGSSKDTPEEMRNALLGWCDQSFKLTQAAIHGHRINPPGEEFFSHYDDGKPHARNFRSRVVRQNKIFATQMENWGSDCLIVDSEETQSRNSPGRKGEGALPIPEVTWIDYVSKVVYPLQKDNLEQDLSMDSNHLLVHRLFLSYSRNWPNLAAQHVQEIHELCKEFLIQVLQHVWPKQIQNRIWAGFIQSKIDKSFEEAQKELNKLNANRLRYVTPYEIEFEKKHYEWKVATYIAERGPADIHERTCEDVLKKMLLLYEVSICRLCPKSIRTHCAI